MSSAGCGIVVEIEKWSTDLTNYIMIRRDY